MYKNINESERLNVVCLVLKKDAKKYGERTFLTDTLELHKRGKKSGLLEKTMFEKL